MAHIATERDSSERARWMLALAIAGILIAATMVAIVVLRRGDQGSQPGGVVVPPAQVTPTATPPATPAPTPTSDPRAGAILAGNRAANRAYVNAALAGAPLDPQLAATMADPGLGRTFQHLEIAKSLHDTFRGDIRQATVRLVSVQGTSATVEECDVDSLTLFNAQGQPLNATTFEVLPPSYDPTKPAYELNTATMMLVGGVWKQSDVTVRYVDSCPAS